MASTTSRRLLFSFFICIYAISAAAARPCKTIFFLTSSSSSSQSHDPTPTATATNSPHLTFFVTQIRQFHRSSNHVLTSQTSYYSSTVKTSIRDRTMDIMSIVGALVFGVGCGALTAATMYLFWSLFFDFRCDSDDEEEYHGEEPHIRHDEMKCVDIPDVTKPVPPSAQEVEAMKWGKR